MSRSVKSALLIALAASLIGVGAAAAAPGKPDKPSKPGGATSSETTSPGNSGNAGSGSSPGNSGNAGANQALGSEGSAPGQIRAAQVRAEIALSNRASNASRALARFRVTDDREEELAESAALSSCLSDQLGKATRGMSQVASGKGKSPNRTPPGLTKREVAELEEICQEDVGDRGEYIVQFTPGTNANDASREARQKSALKEVNRFKVKRVYSNVFPGMAITAGLRQVEALRKNPNVQLVVPDGVAQAIVTQEPAPWGLDRSDQRALPLSGSYNYEKSGQGVSAYIIDTGIRADHQDFNGRVVAGFSSIEDGRETADCNGHGTHVAGTVGGATYGIAKAVTLFPVRVLDCYGSGTWSGVIAGMDWVAAHHSAGVPAVANMSLGGGGNSLVDSAVQSLVSDGVTVVVAAGNSATDACTSSPARAPGAITVAASTSADQQASFSNFGPCVDIYAPGVGIVSAWNSGSTATASLSGTSMASPHVAGAAALLAAQPADAWTQLRDQATPAVLSGIGSGSPNLLLFTGAGTPPTEPEDPPAGVPAAPTAVNAAPGVRSAVVTWTPSASDGGSPIISQRVTAYDKRGAGVGSVTVSGAVTSVEISGLKPRQSYSFKVSAINKVGTSPESAASGEVTPTPR